jgi:hypothetical protein
VSEGLNIHGTGFEGDKEIYYASLDDWKAALKQQAATFNAQQQTPAPTTSSAPTMTASNSRNFRPATANKAAAISLPISAALATDASVALQVILSAQEQAHGTSASGTKVATLDASIKAGTQTTTATRTTV